MANPFNIVVPPFPRWLIAPVQAGARLMYIDMNDNWVSRSCAVDCYEPDETALVQSLLRPGDTFVDVGANLGWYTLAASMVLKGSGRIYAFEPRPDTGERLAMTVALNGLADDVEIHRAGLWSAPGTQCFAFSEQTNPGGAYILTGEEPGAATITTLTLDSLELLACHVVKIDIEGAEPHALRGAAGTIARHRPYILSEINASQLELVSQATMGDYFGQLSAFGYDAYYAAGVERGQRASEQDERLRVLPFASILFVPREKTVQW